MSFEVAIVVCLCLVWVFFVELLLGFIVESEKDRDKFLGESINSF